MAISLQGELENAKAWIHALSIRQDPGKEASIARWEQRIKAIRIKALLRNTTLKD